MHFPALLGHPKEKAEQRSDWTAGLDWQPLWSQEKGRGRAGCPQGEDCESLYCHFPVLDWEILCRWEVESISPLSELGRKLYCHVQKWLLRSPPNGFFPHLSPLWSSCFTPGDCTRDPSACSGKGVGGSLSTNQTSWWWGMILEVDKATIMTQCLYHCFLQEKRRAERAEQQRIRAEKEKERQARLAVSVLVSVSLSQHQIGGDL